MRTCQIQCSGGGLTAGRQVYPNGEVSQALDGLQPGDKLALKGPFGKFVYRPGKYKTIGAAPCGERVP